MKSKFYSIIAIFSLVTMLFSGIASADNSAQEATAQFKDVKPNHWAKPSIDRMYQLGIISGFPDGTFRPDDVVTADQFVIMMLRAFSKTYDGKAAEWDREWLEATQKLYPGRIGSIQNAVWSTGFNFTNAKSGYYAKPFIDFLYDMSFIQKYDDVFPLEKDYKTFKKPLSREKASYILGLWYKSFENNFDTNYTDYAITKADVTDLNTFTKGPVEDFKMSVMLAGLMRGYPDHKFKPHRFITRAEALSLIDRLRNKEARTPFTPDLSGQMYVEAKGNIYLFNSKATFSNYKEIVRIGKTYCKDGYLDVTGFGVGCFKDEDTYKNWDWTIRIGLLNDVTYLPEATFGIANSVGNKPGFGYKADHSFVGTKEFVDAAFEFLAGDGKGLDLKAKVFSMEKTLTSDYTVITFNGRKIELTRTKEIIYVSLS
ncbi:S-layer homology domain-containing protein [Cohnella soli]|uniref:S-layer homology domain-containing protein n=1 Tax=Cohnella soli TaxID=425005 RepID=A0ABW0HN25_9BACL